MEISEAIHLIDTEGLPKSKPTIWADLGCGNGIFTRALSKILPEGSVIYAVDKTQQYLPDYPDRNIKVNFIRSDFEKEEIPIPSLDGILMANSLHYVKDKDLLLDRLIKYFGGPGIFIVIEYELACPNPWVPYPIGYAGLRKLFMNSGFGNIERISEMKSLYQRGNIYSCIIRKQ